MDAITHSTVSRNAIRQRSSANPLSYGVLGEGGRYDHTAFRFVVVVAPRLDPVSVADATGHTLVALGAELGQPVLGGPHPDADGRTHARLARYPIVILTARPWRIARLVADAHRCAQLTVVDYPEEGWTTIHDDDYRAALATRSAEQLTYRAAALFGPAFLIDELCGHFSLWKPHHQQFS
jgi:hypothetical protein